MGFRVRGWGGDMVQRGRRGEERLILHYLHPCSHARSRELAHLHTCYVLYAMPPAAAVLSDRPTNRPIGSTDCPAALGDPQVLALLLAPAVGGHRDGGAASYTAGGEVR